MEGDTLIQSYPWISWNRFDTLSRNISHTPIMNEIEDKKICAYYHGWLILEDSNRMHYIINSKSLETIQLPSVNFGYSNCVLTRSPSDSGCHVLFIAKDTVIYCQPGDKKYKRYKVKDSLQIRFGSSIAVLEGKVYYSINCAPSFLVVIECNESILKVSKIETSGFPFGVIGYLVESDGELLLVEDCYCYVHPVDEIDLDCFKIFQFDFLNKVWKKVYNIGEFTIFLPPGEQYNGGISLRAVEPRIKQNSIYYLHYEDEYIHVYDLANDSFLFHSNRLETEILYFKQESNNCEKQNAEFLPQMPCDVSKLILDRTFTLDPGALGIIRSTCKSWSSIVRSPTYDIDLRYNKYPYLVTILSNGTCKFFHPVYDHTFCSYTPELVGARIMFSKFGWLLLSQSNGEIGRGIGIPKYLFFNPFTKQKITLPDSLHRFSAMSFSSPPTCSDGFVVGFHMNKTELATFKYGGSEWSTLETLPDTECIMNYAPIFRKQKCYCFAANKKLIVVDLHTGNIFTVSNTFPKEPKGLRECFLVEDKEGTLLGVFLFYKRKIPIVMRIAKGLKTNILWKSVENLKNKMVYISPASTCLVSAPTTSTSNKIYFPFFRNSSNIFYSLSTRKYHSYSGNYSCDLLFDVEMMRNSAWIDVE